MKGEDEPVGGRRVRQSTTAGAPFAFTVDVAGPEAGDGSRRFAVAGTDPATGAEARCEYRLPDAGQNAYLDLGE